MHHAAVQIAPHLVLLHNVVTGRLRVVIGIPRVVAAPVAGVCVALAHGEGRHASVVGLEDSAHGGADTSGQLEIYARRYCLIYY